MKKETLQNIFIETLLISFLISCGGSSPSGQPPVPTYSISGSINGMDNIRNIGLSLNSENLTVSQNGSFSFNQQLIEGSAYAVNIERKPARQDCTIANETGVIGQNNVNGLEINCSNDDSCRNSGEYSSKGKPIIGVSWKGGYWQIQRKTKELELQNWEPIFKRNALYINLQYGDITQEVTYLKQRKHDLITFPELDFKIHIDDWVAIAGACDGIISVSTALVHFAGAIGQKVAVVMPGEQGPWHLGLEDTDSIAYKNVKIFRPTSKESLSSLVERVSKLIT